MMIEKHLQHQMMMKKCQNIIEEEEQRTAAVENENFSIGAFSNAFLNKGNSEVFTLNGTLKSRRNPISENCFPESFATPKDLRKLEQDNFLGEELVRVREASARFRCNNGRVPISQTAKRLIDNFNTRVSTTVGFRCYKGPITFYFFEKFLMDELTKLNVNSSQIFVHPKPFSDCGKTRLLGHKSPRKTDSRRLVLPRIDTRLKTRNGYLELRHGETRKFIKIPQTTTANQDQISVTFTIKPKRKNFAELNGNW